MRFYKANEVLPKEFLADQNIDPDFLVSIQSGKEFKKLQNYFVKIQKDKEQQQKSDYESNSTEQEEEDDTDELLLNSDKLPDSKRNLFLVRSNYEGEHIPSSDDFVVFHIMKNNKLKAHRLYQCRCSQIVRENKRVRNRKNKQQSSRFKNKF